MTDITTTARIERPAEVVFDVVADMENNPRWQRGQQRCVWTSEPPLRIGSTYDQTARFLGREITSSFEVAELEPGRRIRIVTTGGSMPIDVTRIVEPVSDEACDVTAIVRGQPPRLLRLLGPVLDRLVLRSVRADYERLRELLEGDVA